MQRLFSILVSHSSKPTTSLLLDLQKNTWVAKSLQIALFHCFNVNKKRHLISLTIPQLSRFYYENHLSGPAFECGSAATNLKAEPSISAYEWHWDESSKCELRISNARNLCNNLSANIDWNLFLRCDLTIDIGLDTWSRDVLFIKKGKWRARLKRITLYRNFKI